MKMTFKKLTLVVIFALIVAMPAFVYADTIGTYETEDNNSMSKVDTITMMTTYGKISSISDIDWFNFYGGSGKWVIMGNAPSGCTYRMTILDDQGVQQYTCIVTSSTYGQYQLPTSGTYWIKIQSVSGYSDTTYYSLSIV